MTMDSSDEVTLKSPPLAGENGLQKQVFWLMMKAEGSNGGGHWQWALAKCAKAL